MGHGFGRVRPRPDAGQPTRARSFTRLGIDSSHAAGAFRFANRLEAWVEIDNGKIIGHGQGGRSYLSSTLMGVGRVQMSFLPTVFPDVCPEPVVTETSERFVRTAGGRSGVPAPRRVRGRPFLQWRGPIVWTTLALTATADGRWHGDLVGASSFPRHWIYDSDGCLVRKSGFIDFGHWYRGAFGAHSPWGGEDSPGFVTMAESSLERQLATTIMRVGVTTEDNEVDGGPAPGGAGPARSGAVSPP